MQAFFVCLMTVLAFVAMGCAFLAQYNHRERAEWSWAIFSWGLWIAALLLDLEITVPLTGALFVLAVAVIAGALAYRRRKYGHNRSTQEAK